MYYMDSITNIMGLKLTPYLLILTLELIFDVTESATQAEINHHLELGREFLSRGQLADALTHYHAAVEGDPRNFLTYYKRGTVYLALGKARLALSDLDKTLELKPDFNAARMSRGSVYLKQCDLEHAQLDFRNVLETDPYHPEANDLFQRLLPLERTLTYTDSYYASQEYMSAIQMLNSVLETCPWSAKLRKLRAKCHIENQNLLAAVADMRSATRLETDSTEGYLELSKLLYDIGQASEALKEIRECLKLDPEHPECFPFYKKIKKVEKFLSAAERALENNEYSDCISNAEKVLKHETTKQMIIFNAKQFLCTCYVKDEQGSEALSHCRDALDISPEVNIYCDKAEANILIAMYDDAIRDYQSALEIDQQNMRAKEGLQRAQKLQAQAEKRDYYKILGVKRTATKKEIVKAYRRAAQKWHPDNFEGKDDQKKIAEKNFIDIAAAKEVLTDDEKRAQFDNGEDPLDPEQNRQGGPNPFQHFHTGSPFQFKFHFN